MKTLYYLTFVVTKFLIFSLPIFNLSSSIRKLEISNIMIF